MAGGTEPDNPPGSGDSTRILRRAPLSTGAQPSHRPSGDAPVDPEPRTSLIRRHPTGDMPVTPDPATQIVPRAKPTAVGPARAPRANSGAAIATTVASIVSGWATAVIASDLITGWWATDPLFCVAVGFLTAVSAAATISGVIALLLRRGGGRLLVVVGAVIALLIFASLFVAGAKLPMAVYAMPVLPLASIAAAALPGTARWSNP